MNIDVFHYLDEVRRIALELPGAKDAVSYGTPSFKVRDKLFARMKEDGKTLVVYTTDRDKWMKANPSVYFITDHYKNYPMMLIDLATVRQKELKKLIIGSWEMRAGKTDLKKYRR